MPHIKVKYLNVYCGITRKTEEFIKFDDHLTLRDLLDKLTQIYKPKFRDYVLDSDNNLKNHVWILVNRERTKDMERQLMDGEVVVFSLPLAGG